MQNKQRDQMAWSEIVFIVIALGFALDEVRLATCRLDTLDRLRLTPSIGYQFAATKEHGIAFYTQSLYNGECA